MKKTLLIAILLSISLASALSITSSPLTLEPSQQSALSIDLNNPFSDDITDISLSLDFSSIPFAPTETSEVFIDKIKSDDDELISIPLIAFSNAKIGDYEIPFNLEYTLNSEKRTISGTFGVKIRALPKIEIIPQFSKIYLNKKSDISLKIVNKGLANARFTSIKFVSTNAEILTSQEYIGEIESDDFETLDVSLIPKKENFNLIAIVSFKDFDNHQQKQIINLDLSTNQPKETTNFLSQRNIIIFLIILVVLILLFKRRRKR